MEEVASVMEYVNHTSDNTHHNIDKYGCDHYEVYLMRKNSKLYHANIDVALTADKRNLVYQINKIKEIGIGTVAADSTSVSTGLPHLDSGDYDTTLNANGQEKNVESTKRVESAYSADEEADILYALDQLDSLRQTAADNADELNNLQEYPAKNSTSAPR